VAGVGHLGEEIKEYVRRPYSIPVDFVEQAEPLGNRHAIYVRREHLDGGEVMIILGDTIIEADLPRVLASRESAIGVQEVTDRRQFGVAEFPNGHVRRLVQKPEVTPSNLAVVGVYLIRRPEGLRHCLERMVAERRMVRGEYWLADAMQTMVEAGKPMKTLQTPAWRACCWSTPSSGSKRRW
jgi:glucose-1-phosphate thymidylyltransferase